MLRRLCAFVVIAIPSVLSLSFAASKEIVYKGTLEFGAQELLLGKRCYVFGGSVASGHFFDRLKRTDEGGETRFSRNNEPVTSYPEKLDVAIRISTGVCRPNAQPAANDSDIENMWELLKFKAEWKHELNVTPARSEFLEKREVPYPIYPKSPGSFEMRVFEYHLEVSAKDVPLANHLIVLVCWPDGGIIARLSAQP